MWSWLVYSETGTVEILTTFSKHFVCLFCLCVFVVVICFVLGGVESLVLWVEM